MAKKAKRPMFKMVFATIDQKNQQLKMLAPGSYKLDKDPLIIWIK